MKKLLALLILLFPVATFAAYSVPLTATTTSNPIFAFPTMVNGSFPSVESPYFFATSSNATSTFNGTANIGKTATFPYLLISSTTPSYGYLTDDFLDVGGALNNYIGVEAFNNANGNCAASEFDANGNNASLLIDYGGFGHSSTGYTGVGCANGLTTDGFGPNSTYFLDPNGFMTFWLGSTTRASYTWGTGGYSPSNVVMTLSNGGNLGIGTSTPGTLLSVGNTTGINFTTATSTFATGSGIKLTGGCFAMPSGVCVTSSAGSVWPFTTTDTNYNVPVQSTTTPEWFRNGFMASTTSYLVYASSTAETISGKLFTPSIYSSNNLVLQGAGGTVSFNGNGPNSMTWDGTVLYAGNSTNDIGITPGNMWNHIYVNYASTTQVSATSICISSDCRTAWPTGSAAGDPFTHVSVYGQTTSATSTLIAHTGSPFSIVASSTVEFVNASTTLLTVFGNSYHNGLAQFTAGASTTVMSFDNGLSTTTITGTATSTFGAGISAAYLNLSGANATSTASNGFNIAGGCYSIGGTCLQTIVTSASAFKQATIYASTTTLPAYTYNNGTSGVGATITGTANGPFYLDGNSPSLNSRVLIKNETGGNQPNNGIYTLTTVGIAGVSPFVLTRATDYNSSADVFPGVANFNASGTTNANTCWILTNTTAVTIGTTNLTYDDACGAGSFSGTWPITVTGTTINWAGLSTTTNLTTGQLVFATGVGSISSVATSSIGAGTGLSFSGTSGAQVGGTGGTFSLASIAGNSFLGTIGASGVPAAVATSSIFTYSPAYAQSATLLQEVTEKSFTITGTSTANGTGFAAIAGTTTLPLELPFLAETVSAARCKTDVGTLNVQFGIQTASTTMFNASTTANIFTFSANNVLASGNQLFVTAGTPASSPTILNCTLKYTI